MYWKAYALRRAARFNESLAVVQELEQKHAQSRWLKDARALAMDVKEAQGKPVSPDQTSDEELKIMAIQMLSHQDPARAIPLLEKVIFGTSSPQVKEQALFVLSQTGQPRAREVILQVAKGGSNPDLQVKAIQMLGLTSGSAADLAAIYAATSDRASKQMILDMLSMQSDAKPLVDIARSEKDPELRRAAIQRLMATNRKEATDFIGEILEK
jgi:HEAT repeat protein